MALAHDQDAIAHRQHLGQVGRDQDHRHARSGEVVDESVDVGLGADIDAARRFVEYEDLGSVLSHLAIITFCWLPPERLPTGVSRLGVRIEGRAESLGDRTFGSRVDEPEGVRVTVEDGSEMLAATDWGMLRPELPAVLREVGDAVPNGVLWRLDRDCRPADLDPPLVGWGDAEQRQSDVGAAGPDQAGEAEHLAVVDIEAHAAEDAGSSQVLDRQGDLAELVAWCGRRTRRDRARPSP